MLKPRSTVVRPRLWILPYLYAALALVFIPSPVLPGEGWRYLFSVIAFGLIVLVALPSDSWVRWTVLVLITLGLLSRSLANAANDGWIPGAVAWSALWWAFVMQWRAAGRQHEQNKEEALDR